MGAFAISITQKNGCAIASEHPRFNREEFEEWLKNHEDGYFVRDPNSVFDCHFFDDVVFAEIYKFEFADRGELFRPIVKI